MIGVMRWMVEISRIDIATDYSLLSSHLAYSREGHFECALHMMGYLKWKHNSRLFFDPAYSDIDFDTQTLTTRYCFAYDMVANGVVFLL